MNLELLGQLLGLGMMGVVGLVVGYVFGWDAAKTYFSESVAVRYRYTENQSSTSSRPHTNDPNLP